MLPPHDADGYTSSSSPFAFGVAFTPQRGAVVEIDGRTRAVDLAPGGVGINGGEALAWLRTTEPSESLEFVPNPGALATAEREFGARWDRLEWYRAEPRDPVLWSAAASARRAVLSGAVEELRIDEIVVRMLAHVAVRYAGGRLSWPGALADRALRTAAERILDDPWAPHPLAELAAWAHSSPYHFLRGFKRLLGVTPHQFVGAARRAGEADARSRGGNRRVGRGAAGDRRATAPPGAPPRHGHVAAQGA